MVSFVKRKVGSFTLGENLKKIRKKAGISLEEMAVQTKIKQDYLRKIEAGDFEKMPFDVYIKGFLRNYAKNLNLNPEKVIAQFNKEIGVRKNISKYQKKGKEKFKIPSLTITPKMTSIFFSFFLILIGVIYFYSELNSFSKKPNLTINTPNFSNNIQNSSIKIAGATDIGNKISINNELVLVDSKGNFEETVGLQKGSNEIVIEASNRLKKHTQKILNIVADYELDIIEKESQNKEGDSIIKESFFVEIKSTEFINNLSIKIDDSEEQKNVLHPGTILKIEAQNKIEISSGNVAKTYVKINKEDFFVLEEKIENFKKIILNKEGIVKEDEDAKIINSNKN